MQGASLEGVSQQEAKNQSTGPWRKAQVTTPEIGREALGLSPKEERPKRKAVSYLRFSNIKQAAGGSEDRQADLTDSYCERENLELVERFHDLGKSAHKGKHRTKGRFGDFLEAVKVGRIPSGTVFLVESFDRLSREEVTVALQHFLSLINTYLLEVHVIQVGRNPLVYKAGAVDTNSLLMAIIEMGRAFGESERKGILVSAAWQEQRERGKPIGKKGGKPMGRNPSWLEWQPSGTWNEIPERVVVVKRIFDLSMNARLGRCELAVRLCQEKAHCWNRAGNWTASSVQQILINPAVTGRLDPRRSNNPLAEAVEDYYPRIISDEMFLEAQRVSSARRLGGGRPTPIYPEALLTGIIWSKGVRAHRGNSHQKNGKQNLNYCFVKDNKSKYLALSRVVEGLVLDALGQMVNKDLVATEADEKRAELGAGIAEMRRLQQESEERVNNLVAALATGKKGENYDIPELRTALMSARMDRDNFTQRILALESERQLLPTDGIDVRERLISLVGRVKDNDPEARSEVKSLLARLIVRIDAIRSDWPEWQERRSGTPEGYLPDWAEKLLDKGFTMFSESGALDPLMIAIQMRNGSRIGVLRSKHTVLLLRPSSDGTTKPNPPLTFFSKVSKPRRVCGGR
jgi:DNA invertase Pin-like site-specific DNA recombinase